MTFKKYHQGGIDVCSYFMCYTIWLTSWLWEISQCTIYRIWLKSWLLRNIFGGVWLTRFFFELDVGLWIHADILKSQFTIQCTIWSDYRAGFWEMSQGWLWSDIFGGFGGLVLIELHVGLWLHADILESQLKYAMYYMVWLQSWLLMRGGGLGSSTIFKKFNEPYAP